MTAGAGGAMGPDMVRDPFAFVVAAYLALAGCTGAGATAAVHPLAIVSSQPRRVDVTDAECVRWLAARRTWTGLSVGAASASGLAGGATALLGDSDAARIGVAIGALVLGAFAAIGQGVGRGYAEDFSRYCDQPE